MLEAAMGTVAGFLFTRAGKLDSICASAAVIWAVAVNSPTHWSVVPSFFTRVKCTSRRSTSTLPIAIPLTRASIGIGFAFNGTERDHIGASWQDPRNPAL